MTSVLVAGLLGLLTGCEQSATEAHSISPAEAPSAHPDEVRFAPDSPKLKQIRTEAVQSASVPVGIISAPGKVEANANRLSHVVLPLAGRITTVDIKVGDFVRQGQILLTVESADSDAAVSTLLQSQAAVTQAKAVLAKAQQDLDREKDLFNHGAVPQKEVLNAQAVLVQAETAVQQTNASLEQSRRRLKILGLSTEAFGQGVSVTAPISGKVLELSVVRGEFRNDLSTSLLTIADLSSVWVASDVPETAIRLVKNGEPVRIELDAYPGEFFRGRVTQIGDVVDPQSRTIKVRAEIGNTDGRLKPEMFGSMQLAERTEIRPSVPESAVIAAEGKSLVWIGTGPGTFRRTPVTAGIQTGDRITILSGLHVGGRVVVDGVMLLQGN